LFLSFFGAKVYQSPFFIFDFLGMPEFWRIAKGIAILRLTISFAMDNLSA